MTGRSSAIASSTAPGSPSTREGMTTTSAAVMRSGTSVRAPSSRITSAHPVAEIASVRLAGRPARSPGDQRDEIGPSRSAARPPPPTSTSRPLWCSCRAMVRTTGWSSARPSPAADRQPSLGRGLAEHVSPAGAGNDDDAVAADAQAAGHVRRHRLGHRLEADRQTGGRRVDDLGGAQLVRDSPSGWRAGPVSSCCWRTS